MTDTLPDRLCRNPKSPFHDRALLERGVGIRFNGIEKNNVEEYCISEGWIRVAVGKALDRRGNPLTVTLKGKEVHLTATEYALLKTLAQHAGKVLSHKQLLREVWGPNSEEQAQYLRVYMTHLRKKIEPNAENIAYLRTKRDKLGHLLKGI